MRSSFIALSTLLCLLPYVAAEDYLVSRNVHLQRRADSPFNITLFHVNDIHTHLDEGRQSGTDCTPEEGCYGGYARIKAAVEELRGDANNTLLLNMGDEFQGTMFYTFYGGEKTAEVLNDLEFDAMTLGNHEFDLGEEYLGRFLKNLTFPVITANMQSSEPAVNETVKPYHVYPDLKVALIGVTTETTPSISSPNADTTFSDPIAVAQSWADYIYENEADVERVILMTHIGYELDMELAQKTRGIHMILGGHSHTLLGDMEDAEGKYPTIVENADGEEVFIVTAWRYGVYLGYIQLEFDGKKVLSYTGGPVLLDNTTSVDQALDEKIKAWRGPFEEFASEVLGQTEVELDQGTCHRQECTLGNFMCDAMLWARSRSSDAAVDFCLINAGGIRATISAGNITRGDVLTAFPFSNTMTDLTFTGAELIDIFEGVFSKVSQLNGEGISGFVQVSKGVRVTYNENNDVGGRLINLELQGEGGEWASVESDKEYTIVTFDFLAGGGDNILPAQSEIISLQTTDEVLIEYIADQSPVQIELEGRIVKTDETEPVVEAGQSGGSGEGSGGDESQGSVSQPSLLLAGAVAILSIVV